MNINRINNNVYMNKDNCSHILFIKVWNDTSECATDYGNIESILKQKLLNNKLVI